MKPNPKKVIRIAIISDWIPGSPLYNLRKLLSTYEILIDEKNPQLILIEAHKGHEERAQHWINKGIPTLCFSGECMLFRLYSFVNFYLRFCDRLLSKLFMPQPLRWFLFYFLFVHQKSILRILFVRPKYIYTREFAFITSERPWQYALPCHQLPIQARHPRILAVPFFFLYEIFLSEGYLENPLALAKDNYRSRKFCVMVSSNRHKPEAFTLYQTLRSYKPVDFYGRNLPTPKGSLPGNRKEVIQLYRSYRFVLSAENTSAEHYITEKICCALRAGTVPIYWGAPNVGDYFNLKRMVSYNEYGSYKAMRNKVKALEENPDAYAEVVAQPIFTEQNLENIHRTYDQLKDFLAQICEDARTITPAERLSAHP